MNTLTNVLKSLQKDAIIWKAERSWQTAANPDEEAKSIDDITKTLLLIKNKVKREGYIPLIINSINASVSLTQNQLSKIEKEIASLQKEFAKNGSDTLLENLNIKIEEAENIRKKIVPKIKERDIKSTLKDALKIKGAKDKVNYFKNYEVKTSLTPEDIGLPPNWKGDFNAAVNYGLYEDDNQYYIRAANNNWNNVSTFTMKVHYLVREREDSAYRVVTLTNKYNQERTLTINTDDMTTTGAFKKIVNRLSNFSWQGREDDLAKLNEYLQRDEKHALQLNILGWNSRYKFWAWANGILDLSGDPKYIEADEFGMITTSSEHTFFIPNANQMGGITDDVEDSSPESKFIFTNSGISYNEWAKLHHQVYGQNAAIGQLWFCASLFRDVIFGHPTIKRFPLLFLYGPPGSGKGVFAESILSGHGYAQNSISLESGTSTPKGILRSFAQFRNGIVWLDEYKNSIPKYLIATIKQLYDGRSYTRAKKTNDASTESTPINSSTIVSGQDMPTIEAAVLERHILLQFKPEKNRTAARSKAFDELKLMEAEGLSAIANDVLQYRNVFAKTFLDNFRIELKEFKNVLSEKGVSERYHLNFAILMATHRTLKNFITFPFTAHWIKMHLIEAAELQHSITKANDDISKFWKTVEYLVIQGLFIEGKHYRFVQDGDTKVILFRLQEAHNLYIKELRSANDSFGLDKATISNYLKNVGGIYLNYEKESIGGTSLWVYRLNYSLIEEQYQITLELGKDPKHIGEVPFS